MRKTFFVLIYLSACIAAQSQLALFKMAGKNSKQNSLGFGIFSNYDIPLNSIGNQSLMIELVDLGFFPGKEIDDIGTRIARGYISIKLGYRKIFSEDSRTGFFIEPQAGYCRVVVADDRQPETTYGDGVAAALETGYSLEVGERGNAFLFGLKYEADMAGSVHTIHTLAFRVSFSFPFLRKRRE